MTGNHIDGAWETMAWRMGNPQTKGSKLLVYCILGRGKINA
jgi:hypothetical protein